VFLGDTFFAAQLPSLIAGSLLAPMTYFFARRLPLENNGTIGVLAALLVIFNPLLAYQSVLPDSSLIFAALVIGAVLLLTRPTGEALPPEKAFIFGLLTGLAYLARTPALFLVLAWLVLLGRAKFGGGKKGAGKELVFGFLGILLPVGFWSARNLLTFGYITPPAGTQTIFLFDYDSLFNYSTPLNFQTWLEGGIGKIISVRVEALWVAWRSVLDAMFVPTVIPAAIGLWLLAKNYAEGRLAALYTVLLFLGLPLIFGVASTNGSYYHSAGSCAPFLAVGLVYGLGRLAAWLSARVNFTRRALFNTFIVIFLLANVVWLGAGMPSVIQGHRNDGDLYARINGWLATRPATVVIASQPSSLNYVSGVGAVRLPAQENLTTLLEVAKKYHAEQIIITEQMGRYPDLLHSPENTLFPQIYRSPTGDFEVYGVPKT
jgi:4-amino-4-deoxy-L-arabinose transferase-like glycosyltransferase